VSGANRHLWRVSREFARQTEAFAASATLRAPDVTDRIVEALGAHAGGRVLDLACGPGLMTRVLGRQASRVVGVDVTRETLYKARAGCAADALSNAHFVRAIAERVPLASASFDAGVVRLALHHFERPVGVLSEVRRILRPGGRLAVLDILTDPDPATARLHNSIERLRDPSHTSFYAPDALVADLAAAGFRVADPELWETPRSFSDWARVIADEVRMDALEDVLRELARAGVSAGIQLREQDGELFFTYRWGLFLADAESPDPAGALQP